MSIKKYFGIGILLSMTAFTISCQKTNNTPAVTNPLVVLTPGSDSAFASDQIAIDYSATSINKIKRIQIYTQYLSNPKITAKDSTLANPSAAIDLNFDYTVPATAIKGQQTVITFVITDGNGNTTTKTATVTVTGSRPSITATPASTTAHKGDTVLYTIVMTSPDKFIQTLDVSQIINTGSSTSIAGFLYTSNPQTVVNTTYKYPVPTTVNIGDNIGLLFTVVNSSGVSNFTSTTIKIN